VAGDLVIESAWMDGWMDGSRMGSCFIRVVGVLLIVWLPRLLQLGGIWCSGGEDEVAGGGQTQEQHAQAACCVGSLVLGGGCM
jgi:hypothetical protein